MPKPARSTPAPALTQSVLGRMTLPVWIFDIDRSRMLWANDAACRAWRADSMAELCGRDFATGMSVTVSTKLRHYKRDFEGSDAVFTEIWTHYPQGVPSTMLVTYSGIVLEDGRTAMLCEGVSESKQTPEKLRSAEALVHTTVMITLTDLDDKVLYCNPAARSVEPASGGSVAERFVEAADMRRVKVALARDREAQTVARVRTAAGERWHEIKARFCVDPVSGSPAHLWSEVDVTELKETEAQALHDARHDPLTGLPNRTAVGTIFEARVRAALAEGAEPALMFIDLDRFKTINDSLGHGRGDEVLVEVARRLSRVFAGVGEVARLGGDEFLALIDRPADARAVSGVAEAVLDAIRAPMVLGDTCLRLTSSLGISVAPADGVGVPALMTNADAAMYEAKKAGKNRSARYLPAIGHRALTRMRMEIELQRDFDAGLLQLHYQPRVCLQTGRILGAEALLRWPHPVYGFVPPDSFIPVAEDNGLIVPIGAWVLRQAATQQVAWARAGFPISVSVNLSPRQFSDGDFVGTVRDAMERTGADPRSIEFEITERLLLGEDEDVSGTLRTLKEMGFAISIDDFGTGYSNLAELQKHPIECLKIDRSFVDKLDDQSPILDLIVNMCHLLKVKVVAEGVETEKQMRWLASRRCDEYQGYLFSRPVPAPAFEHLLGRPPGAAPAALQAAKTRPGSTRGTSGKGRKSAVAGS